MGGVEGWGEHLLKLGKLVKDRLGERGASVFDGTSFSWRHNVGKGPAWRVQLQLKTEYTNAPDVIEGVVLAGDPGAMCVTHLRFVSNLLLDP